MINPGSPGGTGVNEPFTLSQSKMKEIGEVYDLVGFDPRGVPYSTKIPCPEINEAMLDELPLPDSPMEDRLREATTAHAGMVNTCVNKNRAFAESLNTETAAQDVDSNRRALGEKKISFFGKS